MATYRHTHSGSSDTGDRIFDGRSTIRATAKKWLCFWPVAEGRDGEKFLMVTRTEVNCQVSFLLQQLSDKLCRYFYDRSIWKPGALLSLQSHQQVLGGQAKSSSPKQNHNGENKGDLSVQFQVPLSPWYWSHCRTLNVLAAAYYIHQREDWSTC